MVRKLSSHALVCVYAWSSEMGLEIDKYSPTIVLHEQKPTPTHLNNVAAVGTRQGKVSLDPTTYTALRAHHYVHPITSTPLRPPHYIHPVSSAPLRPPHYVHSITSTPLPPPHYLHPITSTPLPPPHGGGGG